MGGVLHTLRARGYSGLRLLSAAFFMPLAFRQQVSP